MEPQSPSAEQQTESSPLLGRDEMNLAEFPISLLADRVPKGQKTLYFEDRHGRLTVTGSDAYGLPTATDTDVIIALLYLTKIRNAFEPGPVSFSRYEIIRLLNWEDEAWYYKRLWTSFKRWSGVLLVYDKCWWNNELKCYTDVAMHIIEDVEIVGNAARGVARLGGRDGSRLSSFKWNDKFIESCRADNLRELNLDEYFSLRSAISKRLYRFLGKRFYRKPDWTFDLDEIAFERIGLSRNYADAFKIREKLRPAIGELEATGFLRPLGQDDRYSRVDRGRWTIRLVRGSRVRRSGESEDIVRRAAEPAPVAADSPLVRQLTARGVTEPVARKLVAGYDAARIERQIEAFDWRVETNNKYVQTNPPGFLLRAIEGPYSIPKGFVSKDDRERQAEARRQADRRAAEDRRRKRAEAAEEKAERKRAAAYWAALTAEGRAEVDAASIAAADPVSLAAEAGPLKGAMQRARREEYIRRLLADRGRSGGA
jgi:hypothetical protein